VSKTRQKHLFIKGNSVDYSITDKTDLYLNGRFLGQSITGVQRFAIELIRALDEHIAESLELSKRFNIILLVPRNVVRTLEFRHITVKRVGHLTGQLWEQLELPYYSRSGFLAGFCNTGPLLKRHQTVTFCDASVYRVPEAYSLFFRLWYRALFAIIGLSARGLLTISRFSREELVACCGIRPEKFTVVYPGVDHHGWEKGAEFPLTEPSCPTNRPFLLAVSSMSPHKNFRNLVAAVALLGETDYDVLIAGGGNPAIFRNAELQLPKTVKYLGYVCDGELKALYARARCFIYPSLYEGFGLPPLEAMASGCPVIVAKAGSLPEVCGDAALYCDPHNAEDIAEKIKMVMRDSDLRDSLSMKGLERAKMYTWEKCADRTIRAIECLLDSR
jgi:glycosyltransferase involved in cell wall biosynthesis